MRFDVPLVFSLLGAASAAWVPSSNNYLQPRAANRADAIQHLRDDIAQLEEALRQAFSKLAGLYNGHLPSSSPSSPPNFPGQKPHEPSAFTSASTSINTEAVASSIPASVATLISSIDAVSSSLVAATATSTSIVQPEATSSASSTDSTIPKETVVPIPATSGTTSAASSLASSTASITSPVASSAALQNASSTVSALPTSSANSTIHSNLTIMSVSCANLCSSLTFASSDFPVSPVSCVSHAANSTITVTGGQATAGCGSTITPEVDVCRVVLTVATSDESETYMEVWLPEGDSTWNGRTMNTDNGGVNGCVHYVDMQYVSGLGFAAIGDNAGHNGSSFDATWFADSNEIILDWVYRARHSAVIAGKEVVNQFYNQSPDYSYYIGCSAGGAQGLKSAQMYPEDFDGIIAGSAAADFNHLQAWSGRFVQLTGTDSTDDRFLTEDDWITVQSAIFSQCDAAVDGVDDGILEDPTLCQFDATVLSNSTYGLTDTQVSTVEKVFSELYDTAGNLLFPALLYGSQVDAFRLGQLSGSVQAISEDWYKYAVVNDSSWSALDMDQSDYAQADDLDAYHGNVSAYSGDLSGFSGAGGKLIMYHGMADPLVSEGNSQRYYLKVAQTMGLTNTGMDDFLRLFRISGMAHCGVGGISGAGAWMFGQNGDASVASHNIIQYLQDWVEDDVAPDTIIGTKYWYDEVANGVEFERAHCRFPYRTTYRSGDYTLPSSWGCDLITNWQECGVGALPRLCNVDGSFEP